MYVAIPHIVWLLNSPMRDVSNSATLSLCREPTVQDHVLESSCALSGAWIGRCVVVVVGSLECIDNVLIGIAVGVLDQPIWFCSADHAAELSDVIRHDTGVDAGIT